MRHVSLAGGSLHFYKPIQNTLMTRKFILAILLALPLLYCQSLSAQDAAQSLNPLSLLSEYNLQDVGLLAKPNEDGKAWGALFQFGRNVPFDYNGNAPREETPISGNDPKVWGKSFLKRAEGQTKYDWLTTGALGDKWTDIVALATDAPATYRGENGGDPCPKGMHIPSYTEWVSVMPSSFAVADFSGKIGFKHTTESITIQGQTKEYEADYYSNTKNEIIGIKCSDESGKYRTAFRWSWSDYGLLIEAKWIGQRYATIQELIAETDFWTTGQEHIVTRFLPAAGHISGYTGLAALRYEKLYYWSASASQTKEGFAPSVWGYPYDEEFGEGGVATYEDAIGRYSAACIRCMMGQPSLTAIQTPAQQETLSASSDANGVLAISVTPDLVGASYNLYSTEGLLVNRGILSDTQQWINIAHLPHGYYILTVGQQSIRVLR